MKKTLLTLLIILSTGFLSVCLGQNASSGTQTDNKTRTVYFYVIGLETQQDVTVVTDYLLKFNGKVFTATGNELTQMVTVEVTQFTNNDIEEIIFQSGYKAIICESLPPEGKKYIYNPDGTWKIKEI